jgi:hypothetical protein
MRWVRTNRRLGSWCALLAIAIQIIFSFGHSHGTGGFRPGEPLLRATAGVYGGLTVEPGDPASKPIGLPIEYCAICIAIKMGASAVPAKAPAYGAPTVAGKAQLAPIAEAAAGTLGHLLFHARAPPSA